MSAAARRVTGMMAFVAGLTAGRRRRIEVEGPPVDVGEDGPGPQPRDRAGRGEEGEAGNDHLVARPHVQGHQGQSRASLPRGAATACWVPAVGGDALFQVLHLGTEDVGALWQTRPKAAAIWSPSDAC